MNANVSFESEMSQHVLFLGIYIFYYYFYYFPQTLTECQLVNMVNLVPFSYGADIVE